MSDALPLPPRPNVEQYRKLARNLQRAANSGEPDALRQTLARLGADTARLEHSWRRSRESAKPDAWCALTDAQFFLARSYGFASWPRFVGHLDALTTANSTVTAFESAVNAVVAGDAATLTRLLDEHPDLVRMRSTREHRSALLHYVSANGVEDFRQKTPPNIVDLATILLDAGADPNAESGAYGGGSTTLLLAATSVHPERAGVQLDLLDLLLRRGALIGPSDVTACLHNGRGEAAAFLAGRGATLDLEGAAGVGRLDVVETFFRDGAVPTHLPEAFAWACEFGRTAVVDYLLAHGTDVNAPVPHNRQTGLHWAGYGGHADTVQLLLERGADVHAKDGSFDGTPLEWTLYGWGNPPARGERPYYETVAALARAGGVLQPAWFHETDAERTRAIRKLRSDPRMLAALSGK